MSLTTRETQVLRLLATGKKDAEIADELEIAPQTVRHHIVSVRKKLGLHRASRVYLAGYALGIGVITVEDFIK